MYFCIVGAVYVSLANKDLNSIPRIIWDNGRQTIYFENFAQLLRRLFYCQCCLSVNGKQGFEFYTAHNLDNGQHTIYSENFGQSLMRDLLSVLRNEAKL